MWLPLTLLTAVSALALAAWAGWRAAVDKPVIWRQLQAGGVVEGLLVVQAVVALVLAAQDPPAEPATFWGYVVTAAVVLPVAALWAFAERTRWSSVVLLVTALTVAFLQLRLWQVWHA